MCAVFRWWWWWWWWERVSHAANLVNKKTNKRKQTKENKQKKTNKQTNKQNKTNKQTNNKEARVFFRFFLDLQVYNLSHVTDLVIPNIQLEQRRKRRKPNKTLDLVVLQRELSKVCQILEAFHPGYTILANVELLETAQTFQILDFGDPVWKRGFRVQMSGPGIRPGFFRL